MTFAHHDELKVEVDAPPAALFAHLDDHERLGSHMEKPSMMMMGGRMSYEFDADKGRAVGSVIRMGGSFLWLRLFVEEVVTVRDPPRLKTWETHGVPRLVIIGGYRMGFEISPANATSRLRVFIDYQRPSGVIGQVLGSLFAPLYARWCVSRMAKDAERHFALKASSLRPAHS